MHLRCDRLGPAVEPRRRDHELAGGEVEDHRVTEQAPELVVGDGRGERDRERAAIAVAAFAIGVVGLVVTVVQLYRRKPGWPFAVATFVLCAIAVVLGGVGYAIAVGA